MAEVNRLMPEWMDQFVARNLPTGSDNRLARFTEGPVGRESLNEQSLTVPRGDFDPLSDVWLPMATRPLTVGELAAIRNGSINLFGSLSMAAAPTGEMPAMTGTARNIAPKQAFAYERPLFPAASAQDASAFSQKVGYNPPVVPQRPVALDYPNGVPVDASGRILATPEGAPLIAQSVVGRRELLPSGMAPDVGLDPASVNAVGTQAGGARYLVRAAALPRKSVGRFIPDWDPVTGERAARIEISNRLNPSAIATVAAHETGHLIDWVAGKIPTAGIVNDLNKIHVALNDVKPGAMGYSPAEVPGELMAEALRAYKNNPNWLKTVAPKVALRIREYVNNNPQLNRFIQFNSAAGLAAPVVSNALSGPDQNSETQ